MTVVPIMVELEGKKVLVVGGGRIAKRKLDNLVDSGAKLTVISPAVVPEIAGWAAEGKIRWQQKSFEPQDAEEAFMMIIATDDAAVNRIARDAAPPHCLVNAATEAVSGTIHFPAHVKRGKLSIAISTNGASPMFAKKIKHELQLQFDERYEQYVEFLFEARQLLKYAPLSKNAKAEYLQSFLDESFLQEEAQQETLLELRLPANEKKDSE